MIGGLILVSHASMRWYSACRFWGCDRFSPETDVVYVGSLKVEVDASEQEEVALKPF
ncbi:hypothetical protein Hanom_Chr12g01112231 [Helianthus anomalus]